MSEMPKDSGANPHVTSILPQGHISDAPWLRIGEKTKKIFQHWQPPFVEIAKLTERLGAQNLQPVGFQGLLAKYQPRITEGLQLFASQPLSGFGVLRNQTLPHISPEVIEEHEKFMAAYRPYHDSEDETLLWEWIGSRVGQEPTPLLRAQLWFDFKEIGDMTPREVWEVLRPHRGGLTRKERERLLGRIVTNTRGMLQVYPKHKLALKERGKSREQALRELISSALYARGEGLLLGDDLIGKVDYYIEKDAEIPGALPKRADLLLPVEPEDPAAILEDFELLETVRRLVDKPSFITGRKRQVLESDLRTGYDAAKIERELEISASTVREYRMRYVRDLLEALKAAGF